MRTCTACNFTNELSAQFCIKCGHKLSESSELDQESGQKNYYTFCPECGQVFEGRDYCPQCVVELEYKEANSSFPGEINAAQGKKAIDDNSRAKTPAIPVETDFEKKYRGLGFTVLILGLMSFMFLGDASGDLMTATIAAIGFCAITGLWLSIRPSVGIGVMAGVSLVILGIFDLLLTGESGGLALIAPLIDFGFAVKVFTSCSSYARMLQHEHAEKWI